MGSVAANDKMAVNHLIVFCCYYNFRGGFVDFRDPCASPDITVVPEFLPKDGREAMSLQYPDLVPEAGRLSE